MKCAFQKFLFHNILRLFNRMHNKLIIRLLDIWVSSSHTQLDGVAASPLFVCSWLSFTCTIRKWIELLHPALRCRLNQLLLSFRSALLPWTMRAVYRRWFCYQAGSDTNSLSTGRFLLRQGPCFYQDGTLELVTCMHGALSPMVRTSRFLKHRSDTPYPSLKF